MTKRMIDVLSTEKPEGVHEVNNRVIVVADGPHKGKTGTIIDYRSWYKHGPWIVAFDNEPETTKEHFWYFQIEPEDGSFVPINPQPSKAIVEPTEHLWGSAGYDNTECMKCHIDLYHHDGIHHDYCEDRFWAREELAAEQHHKHIRTNQALDKIRTVLTREEWNLVGLDKKAAYREVDIIKV